MLRCLKCNLSGPTRGTLARSAFLEPYGVLDKFRAVLLRIVRRIENEGGVHVHLALHIRLRKSLDKINLVSGPLYSFTLLIVSNVWMADGHLALACDKMVRVVLLIAYVILSYIILIQLLHHDTTISSQQKSSCQLRK